MVVEERQSLAQLLQVKLVGSRVVAAVSVTVAKDKAGGLQRRQSLSHLLQMNPFGCRVWVLAVRHSLYKLGSLRPFFSTLSLFQAPVRFSSPDLPLPDPVPQHLTSVTAICSSRFPRFDADLWVDFTSRLHLSLTRYSRTVLTAHAPENS